MNNGPTKKQKSNSGEPVATYGPAWLNTKEAIAMAAGLPVDIFFDLLKKLSFKNISVYLIEMIHQYPEHLKKKLNSNAAKVAWKNLLIELNKMDPSIIVEAPAGHENDALWHFRAVMQASHAIYQRQNEEIAFLKEKHPNHKHWAVIDTQDISANEVTLEFLMTRHQQLDAFNQSIIMSKIDLQSNRLNLNNSGITRIPESLFSDESLAVYWKNIVNINCSNNNLQYLPKELGNLPALRVLYCNKNQLRQLPDSIGNLMALRLLDCDNNQLRQLPDSIGNLAALRWLYCNNNQLRQLPDSIGNLAALRLLHCGNNQLPQLPDSIGNLAVLQELLCHNNQLQQLPDSIGNLAALQRLECGGNSLQQLPDSIGNLAALQELNCYKNQLKQLPDNIGNLVAMEWLHCDNNRLRALPSILSHKFGDTWCRKTLANQEHHPISRPSTLTQYTEATAQPQPGEKRAERTSEASASEEANDNADVLKRKKP